MRAKERALVRLKCSGRSKALSRWRVNEVLPPSERRMTLHRCEPPNVRCPRPGLGHGERSRRDATAVTRPVSRAEEAVGSENGNGNGNGNGMGRRAETGTGTATATASRQAMPRTGSV